MALWTKPEEIYLKKIIEHYKLTLLNYKTEAPNSIQDNLPNRTKSAIMSKLRRVLIDAQITEAQLKRCYEYIISGMDIMEVHNKLLSVNPKADIDNLIKQLEAYKKAEVYAMRGWTMENGYKFPHVKMTNEKLYAWYHKTENMKEVICGC